VTADTVHTDVHMLADDLYIVPSNAAAIYPGFMVANAVGAQATPSYGGGRLGFRTSITGDAAARHRAAQALRAVADYLDEWVMPASGLERELVASVSD
jgi:hypothetical protein